MEPASSTRSATCRWPWAWPPFWPTAHSTSPHSVRSRPSPTHRWMRAPSATFALRAMRATGARLRILDPGQNVSLERRGVADFRTGGRIGTHFGPGPRSLDLWGGLEPRTAADADAFRIVKLSRPAARAWFLPSSAVASDDLFDHWMATRARSWTRWTMPGRCNRLVRSPVEWEVTLDVGEPGGCSSPTGRSPMAGQDQPGRWTEQRVREHRPGVSGQEQGGPGSGCSSTGRAGVGLATELRRRRSACGTGDLGGFLADLADGILSFSSGVAAAVRKWNTGRLRLSVLLEAASWRVQSAWRSWGPPGTRPGS